MVNLTESGHTSQGMEGKPGKWEASPSISKIIDSGPLDCMKIILSAVIPYRCEKKIEYHVIVSSIE